MKKVLFTITVTLLFALMLGTVAYAEENDGTAISVLSHSKCLGGT